MRRDTLRLFKRFLKGEAIVLPSKIETMLKHELHSLALSHSVHFDRKTSVSNLRYLILDHVLTDCCLQAVNVDNWDCSPSGCAQSLKVFLSTGVKTASMSFIVFSLSQCAQSMSLKSLWHVLTHLEVPFDSSDSLNQLCSHLKTYVSQLQKSCSGDGVDCSWCTLFHNLVDTHDHWPQVVLSSVKDRIHSHCVEITGMAAFKSGVCVSCSESCVDHYLHVLPASSLNLELLRQPDTFESDVPFASHWLDALLYSPSLKVL